MPEHEGWIPPYHKVCYAQWNISTCSQLMQQDAIHQSKKEKFVLTAHIINYLQLNSGY